MSTSKLDMNAETLHDDPAISSPGRVVNAVGSMAIWMDYMIREARTLATSIKAWYMNIPQRRVAI
jgi:hypothetical protein